MSKSLELYYGAATQGAIQQTTKKKEMKHNLNDVNFKMPPQRTTEFLMGLEKLYVISYEKILASTQ